jgi:hypothetical protein
MHMGVNRWLPARSDPFWASLSLAGGSNGTYNWLPQVTNRSALVIALLAAEVVIPTLADRPDRIPVLTDEDGLSTVVLFTGLGWCPLADLRWRYRPPFSGRPLRASP